MKKSTILLSSLLVVILMACSTESVSEDQATVESLFKVYEAQVDFVQGRESVSCLEVALIAGQHHNAGTVTAETTETELIITYTAGEDWTIAATHLSLGDCGEQWVPTTGSGNPKVGHFEHDSEHSEGVNEVVYTFPIEYLTENFCFAAHAEVSGPTGGETAWAEGSAFDGNSWAMYVDALLTGCTGGDGDDEPVLK